MSIAIIIPFFQRESGILRKSLDSVFKQSCDDDYHIFIVNDDSPIKPEQDLQGFTTDQISKITVLDRKNGGPGRARNTALDVIDSSIYEFIAFLDSDDIWEPFHLSKAIEALSQGYDFYFSNFFQLDNTISVFEKAESNKKFNVSDHKKISGRDLYSYCGDFAAQIICGNLIGTPTVVFRSSVGAGIRFKRSFYYAGEDYLFWLDFASKTEKIVFSTHCTCRCERGINIYSSNGWGTPFALERIRDELKYLKLTEKLYPLTTQSDQIRKQKKG